MPPVCGIAFGFGSAICVLYSDGSTAVCKMRPACEDKSDSLGAALEMRVVLHVIPENMIASGASLISVAYPYIIPDHPSSTYQIHVRCHLVQPVYKVNMHTHLDLTRAQPLFPE